MATADDDFRNFVSGFSGPLNRLAYLLLARSDVDATLEAQRSALAALAHTRRHWRDVRMMGAPESVAVEALLARLPRVRKTFSSHATPALGVIGGSAVTTGGSAPTASTPADSSSAGAAGVPVFGAEPDPHGAFRRTGAFRGSDDARGEPAPDAVIDLARAAFWRAWLTLDPRHRVPLVFRDPSVASQRLADLDVPEGFASPRRLEILAQEGVSQLQSVLVADPTVPEQFVTDAEARWRVLAAALEEHAQLAQGPLDSFKAASIEAARTRRRVAIAVAGVVAVVVVAAVTVANVSTVVAGRLNRRVALETVPATPTSAATGSDARKPVPAATVDSPTPAVTTGADIVVVQRGVVDSSLLAAAQFVEHEWQRTGELGPSGRATVLWGGNDAAGTKIVVMRVRTHQLADLVVIAWTDRPTADGEYLLAPDAPDYPLGFAYSSVTGPRIGVLVPGGVATVDLVVDGVAQAKQPVAATGFASLPVTGQYGTLAEQTFVIEMFDAAGRVVGTTPAPPTV